MTEIPCPRCNKDNIIKKGKYKLKYKVKNQKFKPKQRFQCKDCKYVFIFRNRQFGKQIPYSKRKEVWRLCKFKKGYVSKYDHFKKITYSTREIAEMVDLSHTSVHKIIKEREN